MLCGDACASTQLETCSLPVAWLQATAGASGSSSSEGTKALDSFTRDLCAAARENRTDPVRHAAEFDGDLLHEGSGSMKPCAVLWPGNDKLMEPALSPQGISSQEAICLLPTG